MRRCLIALPLLAGACAPGPGSVEGRRPSLATAQVALGSGAPDLALQACTGLVQRSPRDAAAHLCRGDALTLLGRGAEAGASYDAALAADPGNAGALLGLGRLRLATDPAGAEALFLRALAGQPRHAAALNNLGIARDLQGRHADAQTAYGEAIAAAPNMQAARVNLALSMALDGRAGEAVRLLRPIAEAPDATARERHSLAAVLGMAGETEEAARLLRRDLTSQQVDEALAAYRTLPARAGAH